jgi:hypothetical protein
MNQPEPDANKELRKLLHEQSNSINNQRIRILKQLPTDIEDMFLKETFNKTSLVRKNPWHFWYKNLVDIELNSPKIPSSKKKKVIDYLQTLHSINYEPKLTNYTINSSEENQKKQLKEVKTKFEEEKTPLDKEDNTISELVFESEKANIAAIVMQTDPILNDYLYNFVINMIVIVKEGIALCKIIDERENVPNSDNDLNLVQLLNLSLPLERQNKQMSNISNHVTPGSFEITEETLTYDGIKSLNFREKCQLMNCFWNCSSHPIQDENRNGISNIYEKSSDKRYLKMKTKERTSPVLNMIYEKVTRHIAMLDNINIKNRFPNFNSFINRIDVFSERIAIHFNKGYKEMPKGHHIPSGKYPICQDYNISKKRWKPVSEKINSKENRIDADSNNLFEVVINNDFLKNIERNLYTHSTKDKDYRREITSIELSDSERKYMNKFETPDIKEKINNGYIFWSSGFSQYKIDLDGILAFNMIRQAEINADEITAKDTTETTIKKQVEDRINKERSRTNNKYKYIQSGLSGSTWKYLQLAYFIDGDKDDSFSKMYHVALAYLVGCYHHSWYEVTRSALDFKTELMNTVHGDKIYRASAENLSIDDSYWILNNNSNLFDKMKNEDGKQTRIINKSLHKGTKVFLRRFFTSEQEGQDPNPNINYLHFYRRFLYPLIPLATEKGNIKDFMELLQKEIPSNSTRTTRNTRKPKRYSGGKKTRKRKSKFPYISRGGGMMK